MKICDFVEDFIIISRSAYVYFTSIWKEQESARFISFISELSGKNFQVREKTHENKEKKKTSRN